MRYRLLVCLVLLVIAGCQQRTVLVPSPAADVVPGEQRTAQAETAGVKVVVDTDAWQEELNTPPGLIPLHVTIKNDSGRPLRIRYQEFTLVGPTGAQAGALPPLSIDRTAIAPMQRPAFAYDRFWPAPHYAPYYPGLHPWAAPFDFDSRYYNRSYGYWRTPLPTQDMIMKAIPEGVVEKDGQIAGFLYFEDVEDDLATAQFTMELVDAQTGERFGMIQIPFGVRTS